ncbi:MAG: hypothetical protein KKG59_01895 [Nanoarchaeota archaeon]|nr:hypothetical protein [Nanoarchaeota archaeon]
MTHSLHRSGTIESLKTDFVWLIYHTKGINDANIVNRLKKAIEIVQEEGSENWGDVKTGTILNTNLQMIKDNLSEKSRLRGVFTTRKQVAGFLEKMQKENLGFCVTISGLLSEIKKTTEETGIKPHTINYSMGIFGKKKLLAKDDILDITTMCGHHMVPNGVVKDLQEKVINGKISSVEAAESLAEFCPCGIFNQVRAEKLLENKITAQYYSTLKKQTCFCRV